MLAIADPRPVREHEVQQRLLGTEADAAGSADARRPVRVPRRRGGRRLRRPGRPWPRRNWPSRRGSSVAGGRASRSPAAAASSRSATLRMGSAHANCSRISGTRSRSTRPKLLAVDLHGRRQAHRPRQRTVRSVNRPDLSVSPGPTPISFSSRSSSVREPRAWHDVPAQTSTTWRPVGSKLESVVEAGHAQNLGQPQSPAAGQMLQDDARADSRSSG